MNSIHDLLIKPIDPQQTETERSWNVLQRDDHILRRFGLAEVIQSNRTEFGDFQVREVADEVWVNLDGRAEFRLKDLRQNSPTHGVDQIIQCDRSTLCLVPFGVGFAYRAVDEKCLFVRLSTHSELEQAQDRLTRPEER